MTELCRFRGFESCVGYTIDEHGNVYSHKTKQMLHQQTDEKGYKYVLLNVNGKRKHIYVHRLVWLFHARSIDPLLQINHKDGNKANNAITNLEQVSGKENIRHSYNYGLRTANKGSGHLVPVVSIGADGHETLYSNIKEAAKMIQRDASAITKVCRGKAITCGGFLWKYALDGAKK